MTARKIKGTRGTALIAKERIRQIEKEGWSRAHDRFEHSVEELAHAGAAYACEDLVVHHTGVEIIVSAILWPWERRWWNPKHRLRNLVRAGALIAAAIDTHLSEERERNAAL